MASSGSKALWDSLSSEQKKEIAAIAASWQASRRTSSSEASAEDKPMAEAVDDEPEPPSLPAHAGITMGKARAHYTEMVLEERQAHVD